ncbi:MAG TPA: LysR family transcriptional regulator [Solirubrobacterales bacterium]|jgi:molybdate transport repressor ModE-like protein|nr:LysR family transcriptional regulator [Solirubrobacterales bacterium]
MPFPTGIVDALDPARLRLLVEVDRRGSISAAAEACGVSQPSATKQLQTLEAAVGDKLVERNGRASRLTEAGQIVVSHAARVLDTLQGLEEELGALRDAETGTLALAASTTSGSYVLPSILQCFAAKHPGVDVDIAIGSSAWVAERVAKREFSLGIAGEVELPEGVRAEPFLDDELVGIAAPGRVKLRRGKAAVAELERWTLLVREVGSSTRTVADRYLARAGYHPTNRWELDSNEAIKRTVQAGLGVGFVSELVVRDEVERGELVEFSIEGAEPMRRSIYLLLPAYRDLTPSERAFIDSLSDCCAVSIAGCTVSGSNGRP